MIASTDSVVNANLIDAVVTEGNRRSELICNISQRSVRTNRNVTTLDSQREEDTEVTNVLRVSTAVILNIVVNISVRGVVLDSLNQSRGSSVLDPSIICARNEPALIVFACIQMLCKSVLKCISSTSIAEILINITKHKHRQRVHRDGGSVSDDFVTDVIVNHEVEAITIVLRNHRFTVVHNLLVFHIVSGRTSNSNRLEQVGRHIVIMLTEDSVDIEGETFTDGDIIDINGSSINMQRIERRDGTATVRKGESQQLTIVLSIRNETKLVAINHTKVFNDAVAFICVKDIQLEGATGLNGIIAVADIAVVTRNIHRLSFTICTVRFKHEVFGEDRSSVHNEGIVFTSRAGDMITILRVRTREGNDLHVDCRTLTVGKSSSLRSILTVDINNCINSIGNSQEIKH